MSRDEIRAARQVLKDRYGALYEEASRILFAHDPIGIGSPIDDEYEPEVDTILPRLASARSVDDARRIIHEEFVRWFSANDARDEGRYAEIAIEVWDAYQRHAAEASGEAGAVPLKASGEAGAVPLKASGEAGAVPLKASGEAEAVPLKASGEAEAGP